jgi:hypothetical protein
MTGSGRMARTAGIISAMASTTDPVTNVNGSVVVTPNCASMQRRDQQRTRQANSHAGPRAERRVS